MSTEDAKKSTKSPEHKSKQVIHDLDEEKEEKSYEEVDLFIMEDGDEKTIARKYTKKGADNKNDNDTSFTSFSMLPDLGFGLEVVIDFKD